MISCSFPGTSFLPDNSLRFCYMICSLHMSRYWWTTALICISSAFASPLTPTHQLSPTIAETIPPDMSTLPQAVANATEFEASNRAHGHVYDDIFYVPPTGSEEVKPGTLLKEERITNTSLYTIPPSLSMSRFMYQSLTSSNQQVPVSGYILWPYVAREYDNNKITWIAWAHGTTGISADCAPSNIRNLWHHFQAPFQLALEGYVVIATDYAGLGVRKDAAGNFITHEYLTAPAQANDVYYAIMAAKATYPELSQEFILMGHSQGGGAAWATAQKLVSAPIPGHLGTIAVAPVTRILDTPADYGIIDALGLILQPSIAKRDATFDPDAVTTAKGKEVLQTYLDLEGCSTVLTQLTNDTPILKDGWQNTASYQKYQELAAAGRQPFSGPLLVIQGANDSIVYPQSTTSAVEDTAKMFPSAAIEYHVLPDVDHIPALHASQLIWRRWIEARFAGEPQEEQLRKHTARPLRSAGSLQAQVNWYLALQQGTFQST